MDSGKQIANQQPLLHNYLVQKWNIEKWKLSGTRVKGERKNQKYKELIIQLKDTKTKFKRFGKFKMMR